MDEAEWLASADPQLMLEACRDPARLALHRAYETGKKLVSDRKLRLFACACCRQVWDKLTDERSRRAVEVAERFADGEATSSEATAAFEAATIPRNNATSVSTEPFGVAAFWACEAALRGTPRIKEVFLSGEHLEVVPRATQAAMLRDLCGNLFRPVTLPMHCRCGQWDDAKDGSDPKRCKTCAGVMNVCPWLTDTVKNLAQTIYAERAFDRMPVLWDSLEDSGCTSEEIRLHCLEKTHARGCWLIDLLLGKA